MCFEMNNNIHEAVTFYKYLRLKPGPKYFSDLEHLMQPIMLVKHLNL